MTSPNPRPRPEDPAVLLRTNGRCAAPPAEEIVVFDGKAPRHPGGQNVVTAVTVPGLHYLGSEVVAEKTSEIPAVRALCRRLQAMFNRWANSLFMHWRALQPNARRLTTSDFISQLSAHHDRRAISALTSQRFPS